MGKKNDSPKSNLSDSAVNVLMGAPLEMLPDELEAMGLGETIAAEEIPGVSPTWEPATKGDFLLGRCVDVRSLVIPKVSTPENPSVVAVFNTAIPGGYRSVWLGADLRIKLNNPVGRVYSIHYDGVQDTGKPSPMKMYRVYEVRPKNMSVVTNQ